MFESEEYYIPDTPTAQERRELERRQALLNLKIAKERENLLLRNGRRYKRINSKTAVLKS